MYHTFESSKSQPTDSPENVEQIVKKLGKSIFFHLIYTETQESMLTDEKSGQPTLPARLLFIFLTSAGYQPSVTDQIFNRNC